jgi:hypothetical protein
VHQDRDPLLRAPQRYARSTTWYDGGVLSDEHRNAYRTMGIFMLIVSAAPFGFAVLLHD